MCIVCSRCVRACEEVQGIFALTIDGRGFASTVSAGAKEAFMDSEYVSCGACVQTCPTATLMEKSVIDAGQPEHSVVTTCAYCEVGCSFEAQMQGDQVVRMVPYKGGAANHGHSCVEGRFAFGYATHRDRLRTPMIREAIDQPWQPVSWEEAIAFAASRLQASSSAVGAKVSAVSPLPAALTRCSGLIKPDTNMGGKIARREVFNVKAAQVIFNKIKREAASLVLDQGYSVAEASRSLEIGETALRRWLHQLEGERRGITPTSKALTIEQQRIQELERQVRRLEQEKSILKKATALLMSDEMNRTR
jgi:transposase-like protein/ferredoxin